MVLDFIWQFFNFFSHKIFGDIKCNLYHINYNILLNMLMKPKKDFVTSLC